MQSKLLFIQLSKSDICMRYNNNSKNILSLQMKQIIKKQNKIKLFKKWQFVLEQYVRVSKQVNKICNIQKRSKIKQLFQFHRFSLQNSINSSIKHIQYQIIYKKGQKQKMYFYLALILVLITSYYMFKFYKRYIGKPNFKNMTIWITGASSGIGQQFAYQFSKLQANLILSGRNKQYLQRVRAGCLNPQKVQTVILDMTDFSQVERVSKYIVNDLQKAGQKLDMIVQNAGVSLRCLLKDIDFKNHQKIFDTNVHGPVKHIQSVLPHMIKNKTGHIVGMSSLSAKISTSYRSSYAGTKAALLNILDSLRIQLYPYNINVTTIVPGFVHTNLSKNAFIQGEDEHFQKTDLNIYNGMNPADFVKIAIKGIYRKDKQLLISKDWFESGKIFIRNMLPSLGFLLMQRNNCNQQWAVKNAKVQEWAMQKQTPQSDKKQKNKQQQSQETEQQSEKEKSNEKQINFDSNEQKLSKKEKAKKKKQDKSKQIKTDEFGIQIQNRNQNVNQNDEQMENKQKNTNKEQKNAFKKEKENQKRVKKNMQQTQNMKGKPDMENQNKNERKSQQKQFRDQNKPIAMDERGILNEKNKNE